jgi:hypothetical protein
LLKRTDEIPEGITSSSYSVQLVGCGVPDLSSGTSHSLSLYYEHRC